MKQLSKKKNTKCLVYNCFKFYFLLSALAFLLLFIIFLILGYSQSIKLLISVFHIDFNVERIWQTFTIIKFYMFEGLFIVLSSVFFAAFLYSKQVYIRISPFIKDLIYSSIRVVKTQMSSYTAILIIIPFASSVYFAATVPVIGDEAFTFVNFTSRGFISSLSFYPAPNNHIFNSLLTNLTYYIPFLPALIKLRLPAILINILTIIASMHFTKKLFGKQMAIVITAGVSCLFLTIFYSFAARGYGIIALVFMLSLNFAFNIITRNHQTRDYLFYIFFSIIGFYTIPTYLYPFVLLCSFIFFAGDFKVKKLIISALAIILVVTILYLPVIILNGLDSIVNNKFVAHLDRIEVIKVLPFYLARVVKIIFGIPWIVVLSTLILSLIIVFCQKKNRKLFIVFTAVMLTGPIFLLTIHSVFPPCRVFNFYGFIIVFLILVPYRNLLQKVKPRFLLIPCIVLQVASVFYFKTNVESYNNRDYISKELVLKTLGNNNYVVNSGWFDTYLLFELKAGILKTIGCTIITHKK